MDDLFARLILGHCLGDYIFQNDKMALRKNVKGGNLWCTIHAFIYSVSVCLFLWTTNPLIFGLVFLSHWPIDRWSLGLRWIEWYKSVSWRQVYQKKDEHWPVRLAFGAPIYIIVDNTMHLIIMWLILGAIL